MKMIFSSYKMMICKIGSYYKEMNFNLPSYSYCAIICWFLIGGCESVKKYFAIDTENEEQLIYLFLMKKKKIARVTWVNVFHLGMTIVTSYLLGLDMQEHEIRIISHNCAAPLKTLVNISHKVESKEFFILSASRYRIRIWDLYHQTLQSESMTTRPTTLRGNN